MYMTARNDYDDIAIIGGGASGLMCAAFATSSDYKVTVFEKNPSVRDYESDIYYDNAYLGRKLLITGKGRCNITNNCSNEEFLKNVVVNPKFLYSALKCFDTASVMEFFEKYSCPVKTERGNRVFPISDKSIDVLRALKNGIKKTNCYFVNTKVLRIEKNDDSFNVYCANGNSYSFRKVIVCTGGLSYPSTGSTGDGYTFAESFGHTITPLKPSLVSINLNGDFHEKTIGLSLRNVTLNLYNDKNKKIFSQIGEMLFAHYGVTGPLVLSCSAHMRDDISKYRIEIDLKPALSEEVLDARLISDFEKYSKRDICNAMHDLLPQSLIHPFVELCGIPFATKANELRREQRKVILNNLKHLRLDIKSLRNIYEAVVTAGGVSTKELNPSTMESKLCNGLYFAGEVIDVDAYTGGFNLQIAFSTGKLAAVSAIESLKKEDAITMPKTYKIAIDGPSGVGKSTLAKALAKEFNFIYVDTGAIYRAVGLYVQYNNIEPSDEKTISEHFDKMDICLKWCDGVQRIYLNGNDVSEEIRTPKSSMYASAVSALPSVRKFLLDKQRDIAKNNSVIMDGRDIGTVILPDADVKIFMSADEKSRAERRFKELIEKGQIVSFEEVLEDMKKRDHNDSTRSAAPLIPAEDAIMFDNTHLDAKQTVLEAKKIILEKIKI